MNDPGLRRPEFPWRLACETHGGGRATVIGMAQGDDFGGPGEAAGCQNGSFVRLSAAVGEVRLSQRAAGGDGRQFPRERHLRFGREYCGNVLQLIDLVAHFPVDLFVAMSDAHGDDTTEEIEVLFAIRIPNVLVPGVGDYERLFKVVENRGEQEFLLGEENLLFIHRLQRKASLALRSSSSFISGPNSFSK